MIMNIESFNISKNVLYKLINKINPARFRAIAGGLGPVVHPRAARLFAAGAGKDAPQARQPHGGVGQA